jgi:hypothetical protein
MQRLEEKSSASIRDQIRSSSLQPDTILTELPQQYKDHIMLENNSKLDFKETENEDVNDWMDSCGSE